VSSIRNATPTTYALVVLARGAERHRAVTPIRWTVGDAAAALLAARGKGGCRVWLRCGVQRMTANAGRIVGTQYREPGGRATLSAGPFRVALGIRHQQSHVRKRRPSLMRDGGANFLFRPYYVTPLLTVASARRIADGFLECLVVLWRATCLQNAILSAIIEFDREQGVCSKPADRFRERVRNRRRANAP